MTSSTRYHTIEPSSQTCTLKVTLHGDRLDILVSVVETKAQFWCSIKSSDSWTHEELQRVYDDYNSRTNPLSLIWKKNKIYLLGWGLREILEPGVGDIPSNHDSVFDTVGNPSPPTPKTPVINQDSVTPLPSPSPPTPKTPVINQDSVTLLPSPSKSLSQSQGSNKQVISPNKVSKKGKKKDKKLIEGVIIENNNLQRAPGKVFSTGEHPLPKIHHMPRPQSEFLGTSPLNGLFELSENDREKLKATNTLPQSRPNALGRKNAKVQQSPTPPLKRERSKSFEHPKTNDGQYSLCFTSISTAAYQYDLDKAATVGCQVIKEFLNKWKDSRLRLYLVDIEESPTLQKFREKIKTVLPPDENRLIITPANLVDLKNQGMTCRYIVNASNPNFESGGSGTNKAIHAACKGGGVSLKKLTKARYRAPADVAKAYPVLLPPGCPLRETQDVHMVIHVVGPNMNPKRAYCLNGDYERGDKLLRQSYEEVFETFYKEVTDPTTDAPSSSSMFDEVVFTTTKQGLSQRVNGLMY